MKQRNKTADLSSDMAKGRQTEETSTYRVCLWDLFQIHLLICLGSLGLGLGREMRSGNAGCDRPIVRDAPVNCYGWSVGRNLSPTARYLVPGGSPALDSPTPISRKPLSISSEEASLSLVVEPEMTAPAWPVNAEIIHPRYVRVAASVARVDWVNSKGAVPVGIVEAADNE